MLSRFTVTCVSMSVEESKLRILSRRLRDLWHCIFHHSFCFLGTNYCYLFYDCNSFGSLGEFLLMFPLSFLKVVGLESRS